MRKVILGVAVSLDSFIEGPMENMIVFLLTRIRFKRFFNRIDAIFVGRKTYEMSAEMNGGGAGFPKFKEYIFSTTLSRVKKGVTLIKEDIKTEVEKIKVEKGKDIWLFGGASLTTSLMNLGLVDELSLAVHPILLGGGKTVFNNIKDRIKLTLVDTKTYSTGLISLTYHIGQK